MRMDALSSIESGAEYLEFLDKKTERLAQTFPGGARGNWGAARKAINIYIRDCLYNSYLSERYGLMRLEKYLELPLDKDIGTQLQSRYSSLPEWKTIKRLTHDVSKKYQLAASREAIKGRTFRVHLDLLYWRQGKHFD